MTTYAGGTAVKSGYYLDAGKLSFAHVTRDGEKLPGGDERTFRRVPVAAVMAAAPVLGGLFVVALPFLAFGVTAWAIGRRIAGVAGGGAREVAATLAPTLAPGAAHLAGAPGEEKGGEAAKDARIEELAREVEAKRADK